MPRKTMRTQLELFPDGHSVDAVVLVVGGVPVVAGSCRHGFLRARCRDNDTTSSRIGYTTEAGGTVPSDLPSLAEARVIKRLGGRD